MDPYYHILFNSRNQNQYLISIDTELNAITWTETNINNLEQKDNKPFYYYNGPPFNNKLLNEKADNYKKMIGDGKFNNIYFDPESEKQVLSELISSNSNQQTELAYVFYPIRKLKINNLDYFIVSDSKLFQDNLDTWFVNYVLNMFAVKNLIITKVNFENKQARTFRGLAQYEEKILSYVINPKIKNGEVFIKLKELLLELNEQKKEEQEIEIK